MRDPRRIHAVLTRRIGSMVWGSTSSMVTTPPPRRVSSPRNSPWKAHAWAGSAAATRRRTPSRVEDVTRSTSPPSEKGLLAGPVRGPGGPVLGQQADDLRRRKEAVVRLVARLEQRLRAAGRTGQLAHGVAAGLGVGLALDGEAAGNRLRDLRQREVSPLPLEALDQPEELPVAVLHALALGDVPRPGGHGIEVVHSDLGVSHPPVLAVDRVLLKPGFDLLCDHLHLLCLLPGFFPACTTYP